MRRLVRVAVVVCVLALPAATAGRATPRSPALAACASISGVRCGYVSVPLDAAHPDGARLRLFVAEHPVAHPRGTVLLLAGGPGQASATVFDLRSRLWRSLFPGYTVAAYDDRGTGDPTPLSCAGSGTAAGCGAAIGGRRSFFGTRENVADMEAVRQALGAERLVLFGLSYGTKQALAYAGAYPKRVERLVLDSVEPLDGPEPLGLDSLRAVRGAFRSICAAGCPGLGGDPAAAFVRLANRLAAHPLAARMPVYSTGWGPTTRRVRVDGHSLLGLALASDVDPGVAIELPAAVSAALDGRPRLLEHLATLVQTQAGGDLNEAVFLATTCNDGPFPWRPAASVAGRRAALIRAVAAVGAASRADFGTWAVRGPAAECLGWPGPAGAATVPAGSPPDVPVLVLAGDRDVRTPVDAGALVAAGFPRGRVLLAPGVGHIVVDSSPCVQRAVRSWIGGATPPARCPRVPLTIRPLAPLPRSVAAAVPLGSVGGLAGRTLAATVATLREAEASWLTSYPGGWVAGLERGVADGRDFDVVGYSAYSDIAGLAVSGRLAFDTSRAGTLVPGSEHGIVAVGGSRAAAGFLQVAHGRIFGTLGGRRVSAPFR